MKNESTRKILKISQKIYPLPHKKNLQYESDRCVYTLLFHTNDGPIYYYYYCTQHIFRIQFLYELTQTRLFHFPFLLQFTKKKYFLTDLNLFHNNFRVVARQFYFIIIFFLYVIYLWFFSALSRDQTLLTPGVAVTPLNLIYFFLTLITSNDKYITRKCPL